MWIPVACWYVCMVAISVISSNVCKYGTYFIVPEAHRYAEVTNFYFKMFVYN